MIPEFGQSSRERRFEPEDLFFSCTDTKGFIRTSNRVFVEISGYGAEELLGRPHNIIRHPDMPRSVFRLLWDRLEAGHGLAAYVKNRAKDGSFYWVLAAVRPIDRGYLSVRMKPTSAFFDLVPRLYRELRRVEQDVEDAGGTRTAAMDASTGRLGELLAAHGYADYDSFINAALIAEVEARRAHVRTHGRRQGTQAGLDHPLTEVRSRLDRLGEYLDGELRRVGTYLEANRSLVAACEQLVGFATQGSILAFNAELAGGRLGEDGRGLKAVADLMQEIYPPIIDGSTDLATKIRATRASLAESGFRIALASLQDDMAHAFVDEALAGLEDPETCANTALLFSCLRDDTTMVEDTLDHLAGQLAEIERCAVALRSRLDLLSAIERNGRVEAARTAGAAAFGTLLDELRERAREAITQANSVVSLVESCQLRGRASQRKVITHELDHLQRMATAR